MGDVLSIDTIRVETDARRLRTIIGPNLGASAYAIATLTANADLRAEATTVSNALTSAEQCAVALGISLASTADAARAADHLGAHAFGLLAPAGDVLDGVRDFLAGDVAQLWNGGDDGFPLGQLGAGVVRMNRVRQWIQASGGLEIPVFSNGKVGRLVAAGLRRTPLTARVGAWMTTPGGTAAFRWLGIAGGATSTVVGAYDLWQQGNPIDAFEREGAGYVADVAGTAFSASTTAFLVAPNPVTGGLVIVTGAVWVGAEVVDHWDDITGWTSDRLGDLGDAAGAVWDHTAPIVTGLADHAIAFAETGGDLVGDGLDIAGDAAGSLWDAGGSALSGLGDTIGGIFG